MRSLFITGIILATLVTSCVRAQDVPDRLATSYAPLNEKLSKLISADTLAISAPEAEALPEAIFLDARELEEYAVSHLPNARRIGFNNINYSLLPDIDKNTPLVVYCTVGYRSEKVAEKLRDKGFTAVYNLYGSLYAWKLSGYPLVDGRGQSTEKVHTYNKKWGTFVPDSIGEKVY